MRATKVRASDITKAFSGVKVVIDASIEIREGEVVALVGENGAGKSTLMKILTGIYPYGSYDGVIEVDSAEVRLASVHDAEKAGIVLIPQELAVAGNLSIAENMFVGHLPTRGGIVLRDELHTRTEDAMRVFGLDIDPQSRMDSLSMSEQRMVMIAGALARKATVLLLDEPTAALTDAETQMLFERLSALRDSGVAIVLITHRLDEVGMIADRIVVMRNGRVVEEFESAQVARARIVRAMIGRDLTASEPRQRDKNAPIVLSVRDLAVFDPVVEGKLRVDHISLDLRAGEIHGLYGLIGAGRTELAMALFGAWRGVVTGTVSRGSDVGIPRSPRHAIASGVAMLTEDRKATGIFPRHTVAENISVASLGSLGRFGFLSSEREATTTADIVRTLDVRTPSLTADIESLSGGNQQKALLGRWLAVGPRVLILDEPTLGVDIGSRFEVYEAVRKLAAQGLGVLFISSDVDEIAEVADKTTVMYKGAVVREFEAGVTRHELVAAATGGEQ